MPSTHLSRRLPAALASLVAALVLTTPGLAHAGARRVAPPAPATPAGLPSAVEGWAAYVPAASCDPRTRPGPRALGDLLVATYAGTGYGLGRACGSSAAPSGEHDDGRAVDWMVSVRDAAQRAQATSMLDWMLATDSQGQAAAVARRLGVMYLIWDDRIWSAYRPSEGWRPYSNCASTTGVGDDTRCHRDHVHISLSWEGATGATSWWSGRVAARDYGPCRQDGMSWAANYRHARATACPSASRPSVPSGASSLLRRLTTYSGMTLHRGSTGSSVSAVQEAVGAAVTGRYDWRTARAVRAWRVAHGLSSGGRTTVPTWRALLAAQAPAARRS